MGYLKNLKKKIVRFIGEEEKEYIVTVEYEFMLRGRSVKEIKKRIKNMAVHNAIIKFKSINLKQGGK
jgi:hypothetical protein